MNENDCKQIIYFVFGYLPNEEKEKTKVKEEMENKNKNNGNDDVDSKYDIIGPFELILDSQKTKLVIESDSSQVALLVPTNFQILSSPSLFPTTNNQFIKTFNPECLPIIEFPIRQFPNHVLKEIEKMCSTTKLLVSLDPALSCETTIYCSTKLAKPQQYKLQIVCRLRLSELPIDILTSFLQACSLEQAYRETIGI